MQAPTLRPFLKWVGGKRQLLPTLRRYYPAAMARYYEPFVGSGAVFFDLSAGGRLGDQGAVLSDENADLIGCYRQVRNALPEVIGHLERLEAAHAADGRAGYLRIRDGRFNPMRAAWRASGADLDRYPPELAAMLIYLNRTGFNGLFRVNAAGEFNVPPGRYDRPRIVDRDGLLRASAALGAPNVRMDQGTFDAVLADAGPGDFVYLDPPYAPVSATANFRSYTARGFTDHDQERLAATVIALAERGVSVTLSNSTAPDVSRLYEQPAAVRAGLQLHRVPARRAINCRSDRRGPVDELIVTNVLALRLTAPAPALPATLPA